MIQAFDKYIVDNSVVGTVPTNPTTRANKGKIDVDIAYGYENIDLNRISADKNVQSIISQINMKYATLMKNKALESIEVL